MCDESAQAFSVLIILLPAATSEMTLLIKALKSSKGH